VAASQGTMDNFTFEDETLHRYEMICAVQVQRNVEEAVRSVINQPKDGVLSKRSIPTEIFT
jgi:hypothetical protein